MPPETAVKPDPILAKIKELDELISSKIAEAVNSDRCSKLVFWMRAKYHISEAEIQIMEAKHS